MLELDPPEVLGAVAAPQPRVGSLGQGARTVPPTLCSRELWIGRSHSCGSRRPVPSSVSLPGGFGPS